MWILRILIAALHSSLTLVYLRKMDLLNWQVVEYFRELVLSIFDCFLVIDYVEDAEICELKTFLLYLVIEPANNKIQHLTNEDTSPPNYEDAIAMGSMSTSLHF